MTSTMPHSDLEDFRRRIGFTAAAEQARRGPSHLAVDWNTLVPSLQPDLPGLSVTREEQATVLAAAPPERAWTLEGTAGKLMLTVRVCDSPAEAIEQIAAMASETMMATIPYRRGPADLGDLSAMSMDGPSEVVFWSYRNVFVSLGNDASGLGVMSFARAVHRFLHRHDSVSAEQPLPRIGSFALSATALGAGDHVEATLSLEGGEGLLTAFGDVGIPRHFETVESERLRARFRAKSPGKGEIGVRVMEPVTLLSATRRESVEVAPARDDKRKG